ncbi:30S ribosomal protein S4, partial [bacterium]|nr:30S ribosomal protein S4 [bacterium]
YLLKEGDVVTVRETSKQFIKNVIESIDLALTYAWITVDKNELKITFDRIPQREELDPEFKEQLVIEYYSK